MTTYVSPATVDTTNTDAGFRAWAKHISDGIRAVGFTPTADTGQINFTTVVSPGSNAYGGYEIYALRDTLQATKPVFIKFWYGNSPYSNGKLGIQIGSGTDGAGNLTGVVSNVLDLTGYQNPTSGQSMLSYFFGDASGLSMLIGDHGDYAFAVVNIERTRNPTDGTPVGEGVLAYAWKPDGNYSSGALYHHTLFYPTNGRTSAGNWLSSTQPISTVIIPSGVTTGIIGTDVYLWPQFGSYPSLYPHMNLYTYCAQDITRLSTFPMTALGASHTYKAFDLSSSSGHASQIGQYGPVPGVNGATPRSAYAMRWE